MKPFDTIYALMMALIIVDCAKTQWSWSIIFLPTPSPQEQVKHLCEGKNQDGQALPYKMVSKLHMSDMFQWN